MLRIELALSCSLVLRASELFAYDKGIARTGTAHCLKREDVAFDAGGVAVE